MCRSNKLTHDRCRCAGSDAACDGVPDPALNPVISGRRLYAARHIPIRFVPPCNRRSCCRRGFIQGVMFGCLPCAACQDGRNVFRHVLSRKSKRTQCHVWGSCPIWFNKNCRYIKPLRNILPLPSYSPSYSPTSRPPASPEPPSHSPPPHKPTSQNGRCGLRQGNSACPRGACCSRCGGCVAMVLFVTG
jgi:hypothetical protein